MGNFLNVKSIKRIINFLHLGRRREENLKELIWDLSDDEEKSIFC